MSLSVADHIDKAADNIDSRYHPSGALRRQLNKVFPTHWSFLLGEIAMIGERPYSVTATAVETVSTARIDRDLFMRVAREFPEFGTAVFNVLARRLDFVMGDLDAARRQFENARSFKSI